MRYLKSLGVLGKPSFSSPKLELSPDAGKHELNPWPATLETAAIIVLANDLGFPNVTNGRD